MKPSSSPISSYILPMAKHRSGRKRRRRTKSATNGKSTPNWLELPQDVTAAILEKLGAIDILKNAQRVCVQWRSICQDPLMWRTIDVRMAHHNVSLEDLHLLCRHAAYRSCGALVDLAIEYVGSDELLDYVTQRCPQIRRLRLLRSDQFITGKGLCEAAKSLPLLEDLEISYCKGTEEALQEFGECCPHLKSLKINHQGVRNPVKDDHEAMAIAKTMPELRHLQLSANGLSNPGLEAILDGCPHLESLDLRQCFNVNLDGPLGKICAERIKDLRGPNDSTDDFEYVDMVYDSDMYSPNFSDFDAWSELEDHDNYQFSGSEDSWSL